MTSLYYSYYRIATDLKFSYKAFYVKGSWLLDQILKLKKFTSVILMKKTWRRGVVAVITTNTNFTKPELRFWTGSNPARGVSEVCDGSNLWQWSRLETTARTIHH